VGAFATFNVVLVAWNMQRVQLAMDQHPVTSSRTS